MQYFIYFLLLFCLSYGFYIKVSKGIAGNAKHQQQGRFLVGAALATLPLYVLKLSPWEVYNLWCLVIGCCWALVHPGLYYLTHNSYESDFDFPMDIALGMYLSGLFLCLRSLAQLSYGAGIWCGCLVALLQTLALLIPVTELCYFVLYERCLDDVSLQLLMSAYKAEIREYICSLPKKVYVLAAGVIAAIIFIPFYMNVQLGFQVAATKTQMYLLWAEATFLLIYILKRKRGVFKRTALVELFLDVRKYFAETASYAKHKEQLLEKLKLTELHAEAKTASTIIMVIGESASRDYMSAFSNDGMGTTPWLSAQKNNPDYILFPHTYACFNVTVPVLTLALTEANQYNGLKFQETLSIVDIAKALGYKVHWYSNQSYIGGAETPTTIIAQTADVAKWVKHDNSKQHFDDALLEYLQEVNPQEKNFVVLHLKGSHFNYSNRYPQETAYYSKGDKASLTDNYRDSLRFTDQLLARITDYARKHLKLQALVYCSDHGAEPEEKRTAYFNSFGTVRIPFFIYLAPEYQQQHRLVAEALRKNSLRYFTNDLLYDLMCGVFDIASNHFKPENSLTSLSYSYKRENLRTNLGKTPLTDDKNEIAAI